MGFPGGSAGKESTCNAGDLGSIPGLGAQPGTLRPASVVGWEGGEIYMYIRLISAVVRQRPTQHCKAVILQFLKI